MSFAESERRLRKPEYWLSLIVVALIAVCYYGIRAAAVMGIAAATAVLTDFICLFLQNKSYKSVDLSNAAAAVIMTMLFPASIPYSIVLISTVFAIAVGVHVFGSRSQYLFHPSALGYVFALLCWKHEVLRFPQAGAVLRLFGNTDISALPSASAEFAAEGRVHADLLDLLIGAVCSPMGTGCILLLLVISIIQLFRKGISLYAFVGYFAGIALLAIFGDVPAYPLCLFHMILFSGIFLVADTDLVPVDPVCAMAASFITGALTYYLAAVLRLEYAPVAAVLLTSPLWQLLREHGRAVLTMQREAETDETPAEVAHE